MHQFYLLKRLLFFFLFFASLQGIAQTVGQVMFVGFNADGNDGFSFVTLVDLPNTTNIRFNDNEWNGSPIGGGGAFNTGESSLTWTNNTGIPIYAGTVITINNSATTPVVNLGAVAGTINLDDADEVLYMFLGTDASTPTTFVTAIANDGFTVSTGSLNNTGLGAGQVVSILGDQDVMIYSGSTNCTSTIANCTAALANSSNWTSQNTAANDASNGYPDFPVNVPCNFYGVAFTVVTYYSRNATLGGAWDDNTSWTTNSNGSGGPLAAGVWPRRHDNVVILSGHTITVNNVADNRSCGVSPDNLLRSNIGPFLSSNTAMFYQLGDITIQGSFVVTGVELMMGGYTHLVAGASFSPTSFLVNTGYLEVDAGTTLTGFNSLVLTGNSITIINTTSSFVDDLIIDHTDATLCGTGSAQLQNGAGSVVTYTNGGSLNQICSTFTVTCTGGGCSPSFPVTGSGGSLTGNTGPGGVGDLRDNVLWLRGNSGTSTTVNGGSISAWNDQSGNTNHATQTTVANRPLYLSSFINGYPTIFFDNAATPNNDLLEIADNDNLDNTAGLTILSVFRPLNLNGDARAIISKRTGVGVDQSYTQFIYTSNNMYIDVSGNDNRFTSAGTFANNTNYISGLSFDGTLTAAQRSRFYINGALDITATETSTTIPNYSSPATIGSMNLGDGRPFGGHIAEVILYRRALNEAQRIIATNYLSAKYSIAISGAIDLYTMDNPGNGNFDHEVAGIGQASDGSNHKDARGSGIVRVVSQSPSSLENGEFFIWGHDNNQLWRNVTDVDGVVIRERLRRIWRVSEVGDVGPVAISFDINSLGTNPIGSNLRLLVDRDGDGFFDNDITPVGGGTYSGKIITFGGINLQNGDRFTLGNTDLANPLPIELLSFSATPINNSVRLNWSTASETNNDRFVVQRSLNTESWEEVTEIKGAGTSTTQLAYETNDNNPHVGVSYYRLKQVDFDGDYSYSQIKRVEVAKVLSLQVYPNPSSGSFYISTGFDIDPANVRLINMMGKEVRATLRKDEEGFLLETDQAPAGVYLIQVQKGFWKQSVRVVIR